MMQIGIIGSGRVGGVLGQRWAAGGHEIFFGTRDTHRESIQQLVASAGARAQAVSIETAIAETAVVVLATPWGATEEIVTMHAQGLNGKILVDCTNPLLPEFAGLSVGLSTSGAEQIASWAPGARVVKALSTTGTANMANPHYPSGPLSMFYCGDDPMAKAQVADLVAELGFAPIDTGSLFTARYLEPLAMLWIHLAYREGRGPDFGFTLVQREHPAQR